MSLVIWKNVYILYECLRISWPIHFSYNLYCPLGEHNYNKPYHVSNYFKRNKQIAIYSDTIVGFIPKGHTSKGTNSTLKYAEKFGKKTIIIH